MQTPQPTYFPQDQGYSEPPLAARLAAAPPAPAYRIRWDNIGIVVLALVAIAILLPTVNRFATHITGLDQARTPAKTAKKAKKTIAAEPEESVAPDAPKTLDEALQIVASARTAMQKGDFDEARQLLSVVGSDFADTSGASELRDENAQRQQQFEALTADAQAAASDEKWREAHDLLRQAAAIAPLSTELNTIKAQAVRNLAIEGSLDQAQTQLAQGNGPAAKETATKGYDRYGDERFTKLLTEIETTMRERAEAKETTAAATPPATTTSPPATTPAAPATDPHAGMDMSNMEGMNMNTSNTGNVDVNKLLTQLSTSLGTSAGSALGDEL
jgi:hypothetical protein